MLPKHFSTKTIICSLCKQERRGNLDGAKPILCWRCIHTLMSMSEEAKLELYKKHEGKKDVLRFLENFMKEETYENGRTLDRKGFMWKARRSNRKNRQIKKYK